MTSGLTRTSWINAWSLRRACLGLGVDLRVPPGPRELPLPVLPDGAAPQWLFFTEEASLRRALSGADPQAATARFWPDRYPLDLLDDKWTFAAWLAEDTTGPQGLAQWPLAEPGRAMFPLLLKARHSWVDGRKLPRGWVCRDAAELAERRAALAVEGLDERWFFLQEWLGDGPMRLLSVGGFFDAGDVSRNLAVVTDRVADYGDGPSSSAMLVTVPDTHALIPAAEHALQRLGYRGPYEFEFIVADGGDTSTRVFALELNPRFWMQHGLFVAAGNGLVRRYLGLDTAADRASPPPQCLVWVDSAWLLRRLMRLDLAPLRLLGRWLVGRRHRPVLCPTPGFVLRAALWRLTGRSRVRR